MKDHARQEEELHQGKRERQADANKEGHDGAEDRCSRAQTQRVASLEMPGGGALSFPSLYSLIF